MNGLKRAKILSYNAKGRTAQVHIHGLTDGASEGITATFAYPVGDSDLDTEIQIVDGEDVYVFFENGNEERPVIHSYVSHGDGAIVGVRRIRQDNIEFISKENLKVDSGTTVSIKTPLMNVQANTQQTGNSTLTGNSTVVGNTSVAGNSSVAGSMAVGTTLTVAGVPIDPKAIEGAFKDALDKLEGLKDELKEQGEKIENNEQANQAIEEKVKEVEKLIENIKDSDAYKLLEEGINHIDEEVQKIHDQVKEVGQIAQSKVDEVRAYIDQEIIDTKQIVEQHVSDANIRLDEANQRIDQSIQANEALVADAQQRAIRAEKELDDKIGFIKRETDSIIADVRSDADEIRLVAENAKKVADQEVLDRKKQAADTLIFIDQTKAALKQDIDQNLVKAGQMIDDAKLVLGEETNTLINQKIEPIVNQTEAAVKKVDQVAAQYVDLDKKVDSGFLAEAEARANDKEALTKSFELKFAEMQTELGKSNALISEEIKTLAAQDRAFTEQISTAQSQIGDNKAAINNVERTIVDLGKSVAEKTDQIQASLDTTNASLLNATELARMQSLGKPLRDDPTFLSGNGGLSAYVVPSGSTFTRQAKSTDNPVNSTHEMLLRSTASLGGGWYPTVPTLVAAPNKTFLIKQIIKMPKGTYLLPVGNATGTGGYLRVLGNKEGTGKFEVYYSVVQCGYDAPAAIHGHFRVIAGTNPPLPSTANPVDVILADYEVWDITALNDTIPKAWRDQITGNASYIEKVESSVKLVDEKLVSEAKKLEELKTDYNSNKTKTTSDLATIAQSVSDGDKALSLRIDQTKAALEEADRKSNANILEVTESLAEFEQSTTSKFSELDTSISKE
ncbi:interleukin-like EMT inducer domain-containing protein, partial [Acinetobacter baumannii]|nr:sugar-binding protein [Acinetobacter baumannii]EKX1064958.1 sugar-binding protein [Acinetobacter baumannii]EKX3152150.1 sugar-binding protein [Acinetobacter baumannii]